MTPAQRIRMPQWHHLEGSTTPKAEWYSIKNEASSAVIHIYNEIGGWGITADSFLQDLSAVSSGQIDVRINCKGGDVFDGIAIFNALRQHPASVTTKVDSLAASIASVIAQAGDERVMVQHSQMMIHDAHGVCIGGSGDMASMGALLERQSDLIADLYASRSGGSASEFRALMSAETWLTADEAVEAGLADRVVAPADMAAPKPSAILAELLAPEPVNWASVFANAVTNPLEGLE